MHTKRASNACVFLSLQFIINRKREEKEKRKGGRGGNLDPEDVKPVSPPTVLSPFVEGKKKEGKGRGGISLTKSPSSYSHQRKKKKKRKGKEMASPSRSGSSPDKCCPPTMQLEGREKKGEKREASKGKRLTHIFLDFSLPCPSKKKGGKGKKGGGGKRWEPRIF